MTKVRIDIVIEHDGITRIATVQRTREGNPTKSVAELAEHALRATRKTVAKMLTEADRG